MKTYIIITPEVTNMGGAQMYTANKAKYLSASGWKVHVFYSMKKGEILIPELKKYEQNCVPELATFYPFLTSKKKKKVFRRFKEIIGESKDEIILESQLISQSFLAEEISYYLGARHIINALEERIPYLSSRRLAFLEYKLKRWEFMNAGEKRLKDVFKSSYKDEYLKYQHIGFFACSNVVSDESVEYNFAQSDYSIISIGRLDKPYILPMTNEIVKFAKNHKTCTINVIYIGGSFDGKSEPVISETFKDIENINLYQLGYLYPVPRSVLNNVDVAIASANSVYVTSEQDIPTIVMDKNDSEAIGVYGYTTNNILARTTEPQTACSMLLEEALIKRKYPRKGEQPIKSVDLESHFMKEVDYLDLSKDNKGYYDTKELYSNLERCKFRLMWYYFKCFKPGRLAIK